MLIRQQLLTQRVKVAAKNRQAKIAFKANLAAIAATLQSVASLQRANCRFHAAMTQAGSMGLHASALQTFRILTGMTWQDTDVADNLVQHRFIFVAMKAAIK